MLDKYKRADFGRCPRVFCASQPLLPVGLSDVPYNKAVKLFCPRCEDLYSPKSSRHGSIDGAYFGTTFPHMLFLVYPQQLPLKSSNNLPTTKPATSADAAINVERYLPKIFGFPVHEMSKHARWQEAQRDLQISRLKQSSNDPSYV